MHGGRKTALRLLLALALGSFSCSSDEGAVPTDGAPFATDAPDSAQVDAGAGAGDGSTHPIGELGEGLSTLAGHSMPGLVDGTRDTSLFNNPVNVAVGPGGNIYVADFDNGVVRKVTPAGVTSTLVQQSDFSRPFGMVFTPSGVFYVQTDRNSSGQLRGALWRVALDTGIATLVLENAGRVRGLGSLSDGRLVLADAEAHVLQLFDPVSGVSTPLAGQANSPAYADAIGSMARFNRPMDVIVTSSDEVLVADSNNHRIRRVTLAGVVSTVVGTGVESSLDGPLASATLDTPVGLAFGALGNDDLFFVSEFESGLIRRVDPTAVATFAGSTQGFADNDNPLFGQLFVCEGLSADASYLYVADGNGGTDSPYHRVRRLSL